MPQKNKKTKYTSLCGQFITLYKKGQRDLEN